jgi:WD40 repeat protein
LGGRELLAGQPLRALPCFVEALSLDASHNRRLNFLAGRAFAQLDCLSATCEGHTDVVSFGAFSPDGHLIVTGSPDATAKTWDAASGRLIFSLEDHHDSITAAGFNRDGSRLAVASRDAQASIYDPATGKRIHALVGHRLAINALAFSPDDRLLATASSDGTAALWQVEDGKRLCEFAGHSDAVLTAAFSPDGSRVVTASADRTARVWSVGKALTEPIVLTGHTGQVLSAEFNPDGTRVLTASADGTARLWDAATGAPVARFDCGSSVAVAHFSKSGSQIAMACADGLVRLGGLDGSLQGTLAHSAGEVRDVRFSPDGSWILSAGRDGTAKLWDLRSGTLAYVFSGHTGALNSAAFSEDGRHVVTASVDRTAKVWSLDAARVPHLLVHEGPVDMAAYSPDGSRVVTASHDNTARLWNPATGEPVGPPLSHAPFWVLAAAFSPNGETLATVGGKVARLWHARDGTPLLDPAGKPVEFQTPGRLGAVAFMPDGKSVLLGEIDDTGQWSQWNIATGAQVFRTKQGLSNEFGRVMQLQPHPSGALVLAYGSNQAWLYNLLGNRRWRQFGSAGVSDVMCAAMSSDGRRVATGCVDGRVEIYSVTLDQHHQLRDAHRRAVVAVAFSTDGQRLISADIDGRAVVWDVEAGLKLAVLESHERAVYAAGFDRSGTFVVTGGDDGHARVWEAATGKLLADLAGHADAVRTAVFSPDGRQLLTASRDGTARLWPFVEPELARDLPELAARVNAQTEYHLEGSRIVPGRLIDGNLAYDRAGHLLRPAASREKEVELRQVGTDLATARGSLDDADPLAALAWITSARTRGADWFSARVLLSAALPATDGLLSVAVGHSSRIEHFSLSRDGRLLVSAAHDATATVWDTTTGHPIVRFGGYKDWLFSANLSPDNRRVVASGREGIAHVHDARTGCILATMDNAHAHADEIAELDPAYRDRPDIWTALFSLDGSKILMSCLDGALRVWDSQSGQLLRSIQGCGGGDMILSRDGALAVLARRDGSVGVINTVDFTERFVVPPKEQEICQVALSPDERWIAIGSETGLVRIAEVATGNLVETDFKHEGAVRTMDFSPDSAHLLTGSGDDTARTWDVLERKPEEIFRGHSGSVISAQFSPDGKTIATSAADGTVRLWDAGKGALLQTFRGHATAYVQCAFSADGTRVFSTGGGILRMWDAHIRRADEVAWTGEAPLAAVAPKGNESAIEVVEFGPRGLELLPEGDRKHPRKLRVPFGFFAGDGRAALHSVAILTAGSLGSQGESVPESFEGKQPDEPAKFEKEKLNDSIAGAAHAALVALPGLQATRPQLMKMPKDETDQAIAKALHVDAVLVFDAEKISKTQKISTAAKKQDAAAQKTEDEVQVPQVKIHAMLTDAASGALRWESSVVINLSDLDTIGAKVAAAFLASSPVTVQFRADGSALAFQDDEGVRVVDTVSGNTLAILPEPPASVLKLAFSGDGARLAAAGDDGTLAVWDVGRARRLKLWSAGHRGAIRVLAFDAAGATLLSAGEDRVPRVWDATTGAPRIQLAGHRGKVLDAAFDATGVFVVTGSDDKTARLWDTRTGRAVATFESQYPIAAVALNVDGTAVLTAENEVVRVWDTASGQRLLDLPPDAAPLTRVAFSPDGTRVLSVDADRHIRLRELLRPTPSSDTLRDLEERLLPDRVEDGRFIPRDAPQVACPNSPKAP